MVVLVGYASDHGSTIGVAERIASRLGRAGFDVDVRPMDGVPDVGVYEAVVLGSAIHDQRWLARATRFVEEHREALSNRATWLFSVSSVGDTNSFFGPRVTRWMQRMRHEPLGVAALREAIGARGHRNFAGAVEADHWNLVGRLFLRAFGGTFGDHRDWGDIDAWADSLARELRTTDAATVSPIVRAART